METSNGQILKITLFAIGVIGLIIIYKTYNPIAFPFPKCPVYYYTGIYCPGCGSQRAVHALANFNLIKAISQNVLATAVILGVIADFAFNLLGMYKFRPYPRLQKSAYGSKIVLLTIISFAILRNIPISPFNLLAPNL